MGFADGPKERLESFWSPGRCFTQLCLFRLFWKFKFKIGDHIGLASNDGAGVGARRANIENSPPASQEAECLSPPWLLQPILLHELQDSPPDLPSTCHNWIKFQPSWCYNYEFGI